jgi:peptide/nickel transport system permease protein
MRAYIIRRLIISIPLLLAISFITFLFIQIAPGDFFDTMRMNPQISPETISMYEKRYHLDEPILIQYFYWIKNLLKLDLGYSFFYNLEVSRVILSRLFNTLLLSFSSILITWLFAIPFGVWAALHRNKMIDRGLSVLSYIGLSIPNFFFALLLLFLASVTGVLPLGGMRSVNFVDFTFAGRIIDILKHLIIPSIVISTASLAGLQRIMRGNMLEVLGKQYILTARAKGLPENRVIYTHALRNAINPMVTIFGYQFSALLSGAALTEIVTGWPGLGSTMLVAVRAQDIYLVMGSMLIGGAMLLIGNLLADVALAWLDPRIRYE